MPTTGAFIGVPPIDPSKGALPNENTPPSAAASQYPLPSGVVAIPTTAALRVLVVSPPSGTASPHPSTPPFELVTKNPFPVGDAANPVHCPLGSRARSDRLLYQPTGPVAGKGKGG
jgi:hypothetical protein